MAERAARAVGDDAAFEAAEHVAVRFPEEDVSVFREVAVCRS